MTLKKYHHLHKEQRYRIECLLARGDSQQDIAKEIGVHASTISREKARNSVGRKIYEHLEADKKSIERRTKSSSLHRKLKGDLEKRVKEGLKQFWSPDQISGRLKNEGIQISHTSIYRYVHKNSLEQSFLRHRGRKYKIRTATAGMKFIPNRTDISERPSIVDEKSRIGDWEGDSIISHKSHCAILTLVDRKSKYLKAKKVGRKTKENMALSAIKLLKNQVVHTITFDNGSEFAGHRKIARELKMSVCKAV